MSLFNLTQSSLHYKSLSSWPLLKKLNCNCLLLWPLKSIIPVEANKSLTNSYKEDLRMKMSKGSFEIWHTSVAVEIFMHGQGYAHPQKRPKKAPISQMWLILKYYTNKKWRITQVCVCSNPHTEPLCNGWRIYWLRHLKKHLANHCWALS